MKMMEHISDVSSSHLNEIKDKWDKVLRYPNI